MANATEAAPPLGALLTEKELAERWGIHPVSLARDRCAGVGLPYVRLSAQRIRYAAADVYAWEQSHRIDHAA